MVSHVVWLDGYLTADFLKIPINLLTVSTYYLLMYLFVYLFSLPKGL